MAVKVFIIGRPGSGKSVASRDIVKFAKRERISHWQVNDYNILSEMFRADKNNQKFNPVIDNGRLSGFEVKDFGVLDTALKEVAKCVDKMEHVAQLITIEFARDDYKKAFQEFTPELLQEAYFLYIETSVNICVQRVSNHSMYSDDPDSHSVPESIIRGYYGRDNNEYMAFHFAKDYNILPGRVMIIKNEGSLGEFMKKVQACATEIFTARRESLSVKR